MNVFYALMIPFAGTTLGAACVFFMNGELNAKLQKALLGFASSVLEDYEEHQNGKSQIKRYFYRDS